MNTKENKPLIAKPADAESKKSGGCCGGKKKKAAPKKKLDPAAQKAQNAILMKIVWKQWWKILLGSPFMFIGAVGEFAFPDLIGRIVNAMKAGDEEMIKGLLITWAIVILIGGIGTMCNSFIFGYVAENIGNDVRKTLF